MSLILDLLTPDRLDCPGRLGHGVLDLIPPSRCEPTGGIHGLLLIKESSDSRLCGYHQRQEAYAIFSNSNSACGFGGKTKKPVDASTCAPSSSTAQAITVARSVGDGFIPLDDRLLLEQPSYMQKAHVHELRNLMPDGYQLSYRAMWKNIISLHAGMTIGIHYHSIKDLGEFSIHPFKVLFFETYAIMPGLLAPNGHRMLSSFINVCRFLRIPLSLCLFDHMFDVRLGSKETLGFVIVSSHQARAFLSGLPHSNRVQVKPRETDDLAAWEATLRTGDTSTRGPYNVGKWGVYPVRETDPEPEIVLEEAIPDVIPLRRLEGSKAPVSAVASSSRRRKKEEKVVKFNSKFAIPQIIDAEEPSTAQPSGQPLTLEEQLARSHQGTSQPIHSGEIYINVDTIEFDTILMETGHTSEAGQGGQQAEGGSGEEEAAEEAL
ncbi:unnamed protein product [Cuscuta campestris]|uniref:Transposase (putative) gypsy type domain-containing protein n=1 Tax=Cuscuta campestris TaxID=132261 RepID=A0A484L3H6_9ASTE|nr:unnamed protein product [Cuscuta campestris]